MTPPCRPSANDRPATPLSARSEGPPRPPGHRRGGFALSQLNRERQIEDATTAEVLATRPRAGRLTAGAFDPAVGAAVRDAGHTRSFQELRDVVAPVHRAQPEGQRIEIDGERVVLEGGGFVDLGGIAKGWTVDRVATWLEERGARSYVVDGGGDIRVAGTDLDGRAWLLGIGDEHAVRLERGALCTSSRRVRRWRTLTGEAHHIIDPDTRRPAESDIEEAAVIAADAATADALATALVAQPARGLAAIERLRLAAMLKRTDGRWWLTSRMKEYMA